MVVKFALKEYGRNNEVVFRWSYKRGGRKAGFHCITHIHVIDFRYIIKSIAYNEMK